MKTFLKPIRKITKPVMIGAFLVAVVSVGTIFLSVSFRPENNEKISLFIAVSEVAVDGVKDLITEASIKSVSISYSAPEDAHYSYQYMAARESRYDLFILRETQLQSIAIGDLFVPFDDHIKSLLGIGEESFYFAIGLSTYGVRVYGGQSQTADCAAFITFTEENYYLCFAIKSYNVGSYSNISNVEPTDENAFLAAKTLLGAA